MQFQIVELGKGRVALKTASSRFVSAADNGVSLRATAGGLLDVFEHALASNNQHNGGS